MRFILILTLSLSLANTAYARESAKNRKEKAKPTRLVAVKKNFKSKSIQYSARKSNLKKQKHVVKNGHQKLSPKMSHTEHARLVASLRAKQASTPEFKVNSQVTIKDFGFEQTPPTPQEKAVMTAVVTSQDLNLDDRPEFDDEF